MGAPAGNQNAIRGVRWRQAVERALEKRTRAKGIEELDRLADKFLDAIEDMTIATEKRGPSVAGFAELADRLDGRAPQQVQLSGDSENPLAIVHESK